MKKLTKFLVAGAMLVSLAACGKSEPSWDAKAKSWLKNEGVVIDSLPTTGFKGMTPTYEEVKGDEENPGYITVTFETEKVEEAVTGLFEDVFAPESVWAMPEFDESAYAYGMAVYAFMSEPGANGKGAALAATTIYPDSMFSEFMGMSGVILMISAGQYFSAEDTQVAIDAYAEQLGIEDSMFAEGESLSDVADWFLFEVTEGDPSVRDAEALAKTFKTYTSDDYYETYGMTTMEVALPDGADDPEAVCNDMVTAVQQTLGYKVLEATHEYEEGDDTCFTAALGNADTKEDSSIYAEVLVNMDGKDDYAMVGLYANEDIGPTYIESMEVIAIDLAGEAEEEFLSIVDENTWEIDTTYEDLYGNMVRSGATDVGDQIWAMMGTRYSTFNLRLFEEGMMVTWPTELIDTFTTGFTTKVPSLEKKFMVSDYGEEIDVVGLDVADHGDEKSYEQQLYKKFEAVEGAWEIVETKINLGGTAVPCYVAISEEVANKQKIQVIFFTYDYFFYCIVQKGDAAAEWFTEKVNAVTEGFTTVVPNLEGTGEIWYVAKEQTGYIWLYASDEEAVPELYDTYKAKFGSNEWDVEEVEEDDGEGNTITVCTATSKETVDVGGRVYQIQVVFYNYLDTEFDVQIKVVEVPQALNITRINQILAEQGYTIVLTDPGLGAIFTEYTEVYDAENDVYIITFKVTYQGGTSGTAFTTLSTLFQNAGLTAYTGTSHYPDYGYYDYVFLNNTTGMEIYWELFLDYASTGTLTVYMEIGQAPVEG